MPSRSPTPFVPEVRTCSRSGCSTVFKTTRNHPDKILCGRECQRLEAGAKWRAKGAKVSAAKRRGKNKDRHITVRLPDGRRILLHRLRMQEHLGRELKPYPEEIVHHKDRDKHHNCTPSYIECGSLFCRGNLELLSGDAAAEHIRLHQAEMQAARRGEVSPERAAELEAYYADGGF